MKREIAKMKADIQQLQQGAGTKNPRSMDMTLEAIGFKLKTC